jgi:hypothetical protein
MTPETPHSTLRVPHSEDPEREIATREDAPAPAPTPSPIPPSDNIKTSFPSVRFFPAYQIAEAMLPRCTKKTIHRTAVKHAWPTKADGNRILYSPPEKIARRVLELFPEPTLFPASAGPTVRFADLTHDPIQRSKVLLRQAAVLKYHELVQASYGKEFSLAAAITHATREAEKAGFVCSAGFSLSQNAPTVAPSHPPTVAPVFSVSPNTLRAWLSLYKAHGLDGLVEQKQGRCGRKSAISLLCDDDRAAFVRRGKALSLDKGAKGRSNVARAARELATHPDLAGPLREHLHQGHASKSYVTPSIRRALSPAPLTATLAHMGTKAARLSASFTPGDYSDLLPHDVYCSDDMTSNIICWCEWPNALGYRLGQPQLLPVLAYGALRWLNFRLIMRESGQYNSDDIWGLFGDVFDEFGLPRLGFLLEGGHWQSNKVIGYKTQISDEDRLGGLASLGLKVWHTTTPGGKAGIETSFNQLQYAGDNFPGYIGREQRVDANERVKTLEAICKGGAEHPRKYFPHISELADHIQTTMENLNQERNDGLICRGATPLEKWSEDTREPLHLRDDAKWLYRSAMSLVAVTRNGIRITQNSGKKLLTHYYDNPELLTPRQGQKVVVYWNDHNIEADAVILTATRPRKFIGLAKYVQPLSRFGATDAQLDTEAQRKKARLHYSRTELRTVQPEIQRNRPPLVVQASACPETPRSGDSALRTPHSALDKVGAQLSAAADRAQKKQTSRATLARELSKVQVTDEMLKAATRPDFSEDT